MLKGVFDLCVRLCQLCCLDNLFEIAVKKKVVEEEEVTVDSAKWQRAILMLHLR